MATSNNSILSKRNLLLAFAACAFPIYSWSIFWFLERMPGWLFYLDIWEIFSIFAYTQMFALVESIIILGIVLLVVALLSIPFRFMRNHYLALCVVSVLATAVWTIGIQYNDQTLRNGSFLLIALGAAGYIATILVLCALIIRSAKFSDIIVSIAERLSILLYMYVTLSTIGILIVIFRNLL